TNPGFVVRITQAGLDYANRHATAVLEKELARLKLPDISGDFRIRLLGKVHYEISGLNLRNFHLPHSQISTVPNVGLQASISNAFAELDGRWRVKLRFIRHHGSFRLKVEDISIKISLKLGRDTSGKPTIEPSSCSTHISRVRVRFSGSFGWLYNLFHKAIESKLRKTLESKVYALGSAVPSPSRSSSAPCLAVTAKIDAMTGIDYSLVAPPVATAQSLNVDLKGECFSLAHRTAVPFAPPVLAFPADQDRMIYFGASSYFFNTAGFAYHATGALVFEITDSMVRKGGGMGPAASRLSEFLCTTLDKLYPNMLMKLRLSAPSAPFLSIGTNGLSLRPVVDIQAYAILSDASLAPLFLLNLVSDVFATINLKSGRIAGRLDMGRLKLFSFPLSLHPQVKMLQSIMNIFASSILLPRLNERLDKGFPLPLLDRIQLSNILMQFHQVSGGARACPA
ncbi:BPI protein, partial [Chauna torquata]|nr:BPI protein [Chauna torquata]